MSEQSANPYVFGDPDIDRQRLDAMSSVMGEQIRSRAYDYLGRNVGSILDLGCGEGQLGIALQNLYPGARLVGVDRDDKAIANAQRRAAAGGIEAQYVQGDIQAGLPVGQFDVVLCFNIIEHLSRYEQALDHIVQAVAPGGHVWVQDAAPDCFEGYPNPDFKRATSVYVQAMAALGNDVFVSAKLPNELAKRGMTDIVTDTVDFAVGGNTKGGQDMLASVVGGLYSARAGLSKLAGLPEEELGEMLERITADALMNPQPGFMRMATIVAHKTPSAEGERA